MVISDTSSNKGAIESLSDKKIEVFFRDEEYNSNMLIKLIADSDAVGNMERIIRIGYSVLGNSLVEGRFDLLSDIEDKLEKKPNKAPCFNISEYISKINEVIEACESEYSDLSSESGVESQDSSALSDEFRSFEDYGLWPLTPLHNVNRNTRERANTIDSMPRSARLTRDNLRRGSDGDLHNFRKDLKSARNNRSYSQSSLSK